MGESEFRIKFYLLYPPPPSPLLPAPSPSPSISSTPLDFFLFIALAYLESRELRRTVFISACYRAWPLGIPSHFYDKVIVVNSLHNP